MGRNFSLFADYHGKENSATNYCGLMFKLVYDESPLLFNQLLDYCFNYSAPYVGPQFEQQSKGRNSIPDLQIFQESFQIIFETKTKDWYHMDQLENHSDSFSPCANKKILVLLCNFEDKGLNKKINDYKESFGKKGIILIELTFEDIILALNRLSLTASLRNYLTEFEDYLNRNNLLPTWKQTLDVVNCYSSRSEVESGFYICPNSGGPYSHKRAKYFGAYWDKNVNYIFIIDAVVSVSKGGTDIKIKWNNEKTIKNNDEIKNRASNLINQYRKNEIQKSDFQIFLLSNKREITFKKDSKGGLFGSKIYFTIKSDNIDDLKKELDGKCWGDLDI